MGRILTLLVAAVAVWFGFQGLCAIYENVQIKDMMGDIIVHHHQKKSDEAIIEAVVEGIKAKGPAFAVKRKEVIVVWDDDNKGMAVTAPYAKTVDIPIMNKKWIIRFKPTAKQRFDFE